MSLRYSDCIFQLSELECIPQFVASTFWICLSMFPLRYFTYMCSASRGWRGY